MVLYAQKKGLEANQYRGTLDMLKKHLDSYWPMIVLVDYGIYPIQMNHFLVVIGYSHDSLIVNSENKRDQFIREADFMKIWGKTDYWTLLITRKTYDEKT
jgi:predicted double-glycine peptidase